MGLLIRRLTQPASPHARKSVIKAVILMIVSLLHDAHDSSGCLNSIHSAFQSIKIMSKYRPSSQSFLTRSIAFRPLSTHSALIPIS